MEFTKYSSIENTHRKKTLDEIYARGWAKKTWVVSEKVHGSNFSFWMDKDGLRCAKRSGFLSKDEKFFNWQTVVEAYDQHLSILYHVCCSMLEELEEAGNIELLDDNINVVLFGEIFGGYYNHPDVDAVSNVQKVQKGVMYCPWVDFYAFDLKINGVFISYDVFADIMEMVGFHYAKALYEGELKDCLKYPNDFQTTLPKKFNLPEIKDNIAEGVVIKPSQALFFPCGSRVILKNKNEKFAEEQKKTPKPKVSLTEEEANIVHLADELTTENRLKNVISKIGDIGQKDFGKLLGAFSSDIIEELRKDHDDLYRAIDKDRIKLVNKAINKNAQDIVRKEFVNIIDGVF